jgi:hypothetical protein
MNTHAYLKRLRENDAKSLPLEEAVAKSFWQRATPELELSDEARELLIEASLDPHGMIMKVEYIGGAHVQTHGKTFGKGGDRRLFAKWEFAVEQLEQAGLLAARGHEGQVFVLTAKGYEAADKLKG